jgi:hypothetical protein
MTKPTIALVLPVVAIALGVLSQARHSPPDAGATDPSTDASAPAEERRGMPRVDPSDGNFAGEVREHLDAGSYTYLLVTTDEGGREWIVTLGDGAPVGSRVDIVNMGVRTDFRSRRLARTFDRLVFAIVRERG